MTLVAERRAQLDLAIEVGAGSSNSLVAPAGSARHPAFLITHEGWPYYATTGELHSIGAATEIFYEWITHGGLSAGLEFRPRRPGSGFEGYTDRHHGETQ